MSDLSPPLCIGVIKAVLNEFGILHSTKIVLNIFSRISDIDSLICFIIFIVIPSLPVAESPW